MKRRSYIASVTIAYAVGALLWIYLSDRFIESVGGSIGFGVFSTLKGFVFVAVTTALLYFALHTAAQGKDAARPILMFRGWVLFAVLALLTLPAGLISYSVFRSASDTLLGERRGQLEFMTEAVARSIDAEVARRMLEATPHVAQAPQATLLAIVTNGSAGFSRLQDFAGLMGDSARVLIASKTGSDGRWMIAGAQQALPEALVPLAADGADGLAADIVSPPGGEPLLAAAAMIPAANAVLVATVATADVVDDVRGVAFLSAMTAAACLLVAGVLTLLFIQRQRLRVALAEADQKAALHAAEERFRATFEQAAEGIAHLDLDGRFLRVNETLCALLGYGRAELLGRSYADVRPNIRAGAGGTSREAVASLPSGTVVEARGDQPHLTRAGEEIWLSCVQSIARDTPEDAGYIILMVSDATARRTAEHHLTLAQAVFTNTQEGLVVTDLAGRITAVNPAFVAITGHQEAEILGQNMRFLSSGRHDRLFYQLLWTALKDTGVWRGEIWNRRKDGTLYLQQTVISTVYGRTGAAESYVGAFNDITQARKSEIEVDRLTRYDPLTGLPNRTLTYSLIEHELTREGTRCAVLYIDIDHLKTINDSLGFAAGDTVLRAAAQRIRRTAPEDATIGRYGADEFVVVIDAGEGPQAVVSLAVRLIEALGEPFAAEGVSDLFVNASIGISLFPEDASDADTLLQHAHSALFEAKSRDGRTYAFYTDALTRDARARIQLVANLRRALTEHEFTVHYQPIVRLEDQTIVGAEALVRWITPEGEMIGPDRFIPVAEETGLIVPLGDFVLAAACTQMARWRKAGLPCAFVAVNISAGQLSATDICAKTEAALAASGVPADSIEFEITESMLFGADSGAESKLKRITELGVRIAIDDFGTGYSSLAYLKRFPISRLKIDKSFVDDLPLSVVDGELVRAMIEMGRALHIEVLAEGVEDAGQMAFLAANGCTYGQGFFWSRPLPPERFEALFSNASQIPGARAGTA
ncbi:bifunctional diguanylate cyclase/phosphodiesterase [Xanthobacter sp. YC-JY1]|uniref:putative bifunctional diguanylate cyclase/phosphodiesterase n=1 Tax=Xanthobacter sp. YC-JY1 TaxID=2419844 RepID=UPI00273858BA|nr:EAL domain-containing protein [Xanthobacter sp. YC-JY1]